MCSKYHTLKDVMRVGHICLILQKTDFYIVFQFYNHIKMLTTLSTSTRFRLKVVTSVNNNIALTS